VAIGFMAKMSEGVLQHAKLPIPFEPSSQQYWFVDVIAPLQNLMPAVESFATGIVSHVINSDRLSNCTYESCTGLNTLGLSTFCPYILLSNNPGCHHYSAGRHHLSSIRPQVHNMNCGLWSHCYIEIQNLSCECH